MCMSMCIHVREWSVLANWVFVLQNDLCSFLPVVVVTVVVIVVVVVLLLLLLSEQEERWQNCETFAKFTKSVDQDCPSTIPTWRSIYTKTTHTQLQTVQRTRKWAWFLKTNADWNKLPEEVTTFHEPRIVPVTVVLNHLFTLPLPALSSQTTIFKVTASSQRFMKLVTHRKKKRKMNKWSRHSGVASPSATGY